VAALLLLLLLVVVLWVSVAAAAAVRLEMLAWVVLQAAAACMVVYDSCEADLCLCFCVCACIRHACLMLPSRHYLQSCPCVTWSPGAVSAAVATDNSEPFLSFKLCMHSCTVIGLASVAESVCLLVRR
jgi:hypothetical protein